jgi:predicted cobalt transporter CbtA
MSSKDEQQPQSESSRMPPGRIQWLAGMAGSATGIALLGVSGVLSLLAIFLIVGAAVSRGFPRAGRWFILAPALLECARSPLLCRQPRRAR